MSGGRESPDGCFYYAAEKFQKYFIPKDENRQKIHKKREKVNNQPKRYVIL